ncbi:MAG: hypothetical protein J6I64_05525, partial [Lachnospiraceae bacterium]|nr:hypothetical protein [Lachnospiraceae bacterium]
MSVFSHYIPKAPEGMPLTDIVGYSAQFPGAAVDGDKLRVHYQKYVAQHDTLECGVLGENGLEEVTTLSGDGEVLYPVSLSYEDAVWYTWSEAKGGKWAICVRWIKDGQWSPIMTVAEDEALLYPNFFVWKDQLYLIWTNQHRNAA